MDSAALLSCQGSLPQCVQEALEAVNSGATTLKLKVRPGCDRDHNTILLAPYALEVKKDDMLCRLHSCTTPLPQL